MRSIFVHLDIKPSNLLVDENMNAKFGDLGVSSKIKRENVAADYWDIYVRLIIDIFMSYLYFFVILYLIFFINFNKFVYLFK